MEKICDRDITGNAQRHIDQEIGNQEDKTTTILTVCECTLNKVSHAAEWDGIRLNKK